MKRTADEQLLDQARNKLTECYEGFRLVRYFWCAPGVLGLVFSMPSRRLLRANSGLEIRFELFYDSRWEVKQQHERLRLFNEQQNYGLAGISLYYRHMKTEAQIRAFAKQYLRSAGERAGQFEPRDGGYSIVPFSREVEQVDWYVPADEIDDRPTYDN